MSSSLSTIVDNLPKRTYRIKCKYEHNNQNVRNVELNTKILSDLEYKNIIYYYLNVFVVTGITKKGLMKT